MLEAPSELLEDRRRKGLDRFDEVWEGVLHMVPPPSRWHQELEGELLVVLGPLARRRGLGCVHDAGLFRSDQDYREPDLMVYR
ncbi:MAG TPA: Uma2 family endonuclease, partial [Myxococcales bacterium]|nr:Uma2 family endonuclease [Myxococcales bacterium]